MTRGELLAVTICAAIGTGLAVVSIVSGFEPALIGALVALAGIHEIRERSLKRQLREERAIRLRDCARR